MNDIICLLFLFFLPVLKPDSETFRWNLNNSKEKYVKVEISRQVLYAKQNSSLNDSYSEPETDQCHFMEYSH